MRDTSKRSKLPNKRTNSLLGIKQATHSKPVNPKGWFSLAHKHKHKPIYADAVRC